MNSKAHNPVTVKHHGATCIATRRTSYLIISLLTFGIATGQGPIAQAEDTKENTNEAPKIVSTIPAIGATDVDPATIEMSLTFSQKMGGGMSWTGGGDAFPKITDRPRWEEGKTCIAPIKLEAAKFYRVGVNASSFQNFQGTNGRPSEFNVLYFVTKGATDEEKAKVELPGIASMSPAKDAEDIDAVTVTELVVTFDRKMGGGMSWTKADWLFPETTGRAQWNEDGTTCTMPVSLKSGTEYTLGINHPYANNFQSEWGVPVEPVVWRFTTKAN